MPSDTQKLGQKKWVHAPITTKHDLLYVLQILYKLNFNIDSREKVIEILEAHLNPGLLRQVREKLTDEEYTGPRRDGNPSIVERVKGFGTTTNDIAQTRTPSWPQHYEDVTDPLSHTVDNVFERELAEPVPENVQPQVRQMLEDERTEQEQSETLKQKYWRERPTPRTRPQTDEEFTEVAIERLYEQYGSDFVEEERKTDPTNYNRLLRSELAKLRVELKTPAKQQGPVAPGLKTETIVKRSDIYIDAQEQNKLNALHRWLGWLSEAGFDLSSLEIAQDLGRHSADLGARTVQELTPQQYKQIWDSGEIQQMMGGEQATLTEQSQHAEEERQRIQEQEREQQRFVPSEPVPLKPRVRPPDVVTLDELANSPRGQEMLIRLVMSMLIKFRFGQIYKRDVEGNIVRDKSGSPVTDNDKWSQFRQYINNNRRNEMFALTPVTDDQGQANGEEITVSPERTSAYARRFIQELDTRDFKDPIFKEIADRLDQAMIQANIKAQSLTPKYNIPNAKTLTKEQIAEKEQEQRTAHFDVVADSITDIALSLPYSGPWEWQIKKQEPVTKQKRRELEDARTEEDIQRQMSEYKARRGMPELPNNFNPALPQTFDNPPIMPGFHWGKPISYVKGTGQMLPLMIRPPSRTKLLSMPTHNGRPSQAYIGQGVFVMGRTAQAPKDVHVYEGLGFIIGVQGGPNGLIRQRPTEAEPNGATYKKDEYPTLMIWSPRSQTVFPVQAGPTGKLMADANLSTIDTGDDNPNTNSAYYTGWEGYRGEMTTKARANERLNTQKEQRAAMTITDIVRRVMAQVAPFTSPPVSGPPFDQSQLPQSSSATLPQAPSGEPVQPGDMIQPSNTGGGGDPAQKGKVQEVTPTGDVIFQNELGNKVVQKPTEPTEVIKQAVHIAMQRQVSKRLIQ